MKPLLKLLSRARARMVLTLPLRQVRGLLRRERKLLLSLKCPKETVADLLFARGIDVGIIQTDVLEALKQKPPFPDVEKFLQYIAKLYDQEIHILARNDIRSLNDLRYKRVNFGTYESGTYTSANAIFQTLGFPVQSTMYPQPLALEKLRRGEIAAMVYTAGKPARLC